MRDRIGTGEMRDAGMIEEGGMIAGTGAPETIAETGARGRIVEIGGIEIPAGIGDLAMTVETEDLEIIVEREDGGMIAERDGTEMIAEIDTTEEIEETSDTTIHLNTEIQILTIRQRSRDIRQTLNDMTVMMINMIIRGETPMIDTMTDATHLNIRNLPLSQLRREEGFIYTEAGERRLGT